MDNSDNVSQSQPKKRRRYKLYLEPSTKNNSTDVISKTTGWRWEKQLVNKPSTSQTHTVFINDYTDAMETDPITIASQVDDENDETSDESTRSDLSSDEFNTDSGVFQRTPELHDTEVTNNDENPLETNNEDEIIFPAAGLTRKAVQMMVLGIGLRHHLSNEARKDILEVIQLCANLHDDSFSTNYFFAKEFDPPDDIIKYTFYCEECKSELCSNVTKSEFKNEIKQCSNCNSAQEVSLTGTNHFILTDISYPLKMMLEDKRLFNMIMAERNITETEFSDVHDGELFKSLKKKTAFDITYNFNTDGAPIFASSKKSMWPIQLIINELPPEERFKRLIFAGIWIGSGEPKSNLMNTIWRCFAKNAKVLLNSGIQIVNPNTGLRTIIKILPLLCCVDSVARPVLQSRKQFNGYFGCSWCYHSGTCVQKQIKYPVKDDVPLRTVESHLKDLHKVVQNEYNTTERGVKGPSSLLLLPHFDIVWSLPPDYMHGVTLGVVRQLCDLWLTYTGESKHTYYIGAPTTMKKLNERLLLIQPTQNIHRLPRSFNEKSKWKATEWKSWLLYYSLPCLTNILKPVYLNNLALLVNAIFLLLQEKITITDLQMAESCLRKFVIGVEKLYGVATMTYNIHSLLHLPESVRRTGPLWASSTFPYESGIFQLKQQVKGPVGIEKQIAKKMVTINTFLYKIGKPSLSFNEQCYNFCTNLFSNYKPNRINVQKSEMVTFIGLGLRLTEVNLLNYLDLLNIDANEAQKTPWFSYSKCIINKVMHHSREYKKAKKTNDTFIETKSGQFAQILQFVNSDLGNYMYIQNYQTVRQRFDGTAVAHLHKIISKSKRSVIPICNIERKCMFLKVDENEYICQFPNKCEIQ